MFALAVVLLIANLLVGSFNAEFEIKSKTEFDKNFKPSQVDSLFIISLKRYNIGQKWIHKESSKKNKSKSSLFIYKIDVPKDLANILLIKEIYKNFSKTKLKISSREIKFGGSSILEIFNAKDLILLAELKYKKDISHLAGYLNLFVIMPEDIGDENKNEILNSPKKFTVLFLPSVNNIDLANEVSGNEKDFALLINNDINELKYKIKNSFDVVRINQGVNTVLKSFPKTSFILFSSNFNPNYKIRTAFKNKKMKFLYQKNLINFTKGYKTGFKKLFKSYVMNTGVNDTLNVILSADNFLKIENDLIEFGKLGYRFMTK